MGAAQSRTTSFGKGYAAPHGRRGSIEYVAWVLLLHRVLHLILGRLLSAGKLAFEVLRALRLIFWLLREAGDLGPNLADSGLVVPDLSA